MNLRFFRTEKDSLVYLRNTCCCVLQTCSAGVVAGETLPALTSGRNTAGRNCRPFLYLKTKINENSIMNIKMSPKSRLGWLSVFLICIMIGLFLTATFFANTFYFWEILFYIPKRQSQAMYKLRALFCHTILSFLFFFCLCVCVLIVLFLCFFAFENKQSKSKKNTTVCIYNFRMCVAIFIVKFIFFRNVFAGNSNQPFVLKMCFFLFQRNKKKRKYKHKNKK